MSRIMNKETFSAIQKDITVSGTPEQLSDIPVDNGIAIVVKAKRGNTGLITVGDSSANALNSGTSNFVLQANQSISLQLQNFDKIWLDATVSGEGVEVVAEV